MNMSNISYDNYMDNHRVQALSPIACSFPENPTVFDYTYCIIYSLFCLGALVIGGYLYFKQMLNKKTINSPNNQNV